MVTIELRNVLIDAFHGIHEEEGTLGNQFEINLEVSYQEKEENFDNLDDTIDYSKLYELVKQRMMVPTPLLEKLCASIIRRIRHKYPFTCAVKLSIYKLTAPVAGFDGRVGVTMYKTFDA